jgi:NCS1 family nucleobase:cation symporter-1
MKSVRFEGVAHELTEQGLNEIAKSSLWNPDLSPTPISHRTWTFYNYFSLWVGMVYCVPTWLLVSGMIPGLSWLQAMVAIIIGSVLIGGIVYLNGHAGSKYGIPSAVYYRSSWGTRGSVFGQFVRATVAMGYAGLEIYIGGSAIDGLLLSLIPSWGNFAAHLWFSVGAFWLVTFILVLLSSPQQEMIGYKILNAIALPCMILIGFSVILALYMRVGSWGPLFSTPGEVTGSAWLAFYASCAIAAFGNWGDVMTQVPDFTRFGKDPKVSGLGSFVGLVVGMITFAIIGVSSASFSKALYGEMIWNPIDLIVKLQIPWLTVFSLVFICLLTLTTNIGANITSCGFLFANAFPKHISWRVGGIITLIIGILIRPWHLLDSYGNFLFDWLLLWMCWIAPLGGIIISDYWLVRKTDLDLRELFNETGIYSYFKGFNPCAFGTWLVVTLVCLAFKNYSYVIGLPLAAGLYYLTMHYWALNRVVKPIRHENVKEQKIIS